MFSRAKTGGQKMSSITNRSLREPYSVPSRAEEARDNKDLVPIVFDKDKPLPADYRPGKVYWVESALADQFCRKSKVAERLDRKKELVKVKGSKIDNQAGEGD
jgi:hypothetical protein